MKNVTAWWIFWGAVILGVMADLLLNGQNHGLAVPIVLIAGVGAVELIARSNSIALRPEARVLLWSSVLFGASIAWRDSATLTMLNFSAIALIGLLVALRGREGAFSQAAVTEYLVGVIPVGLQTAFGFISLLRSDLDWAEASNKKNTGTLLTVLRGVLVGAPLVLLFGWLFAQADAQFGSMVSRLFNWNFSAFWSHVWFASFCFILAAGTLKAVLVRVDAVQIPVRPQWSSIGPGEVFIVLGMLNVLFFAFVIVQFQFLFGSHEIVRLSAGMSYADYARSGFFELVWVTLLVLPTLLFLHWVLKQPSPSQLLVFRCLTCALVAQLYVIMVSAIHRMQLYVLAFGLTELRLYVTAFMVWLAIVFVWFLLTVLAERRERFAFGALVTGLEIVLLLNCINPDGLIVRYNSTRVSSAPGFDTSYAECLSADAIPELIGFLNRTSNKQQHLAVAGFLLQNYGPKKPEDWRSWNWSRETAVSEAREKNAELARYPFNGSI